ncbi:MAG: STAS domain-containing protein [Ruminococcaceae bacterium]|nr:STAS domain-containing protein [Oscillospiraceae bacterium]
MNELKPMLFRSLKGYTKKQFINDLISGIIVAIIALPLSIALALASGVGPEEGLYTAIVAGFLISFFGGSTVQIAGPTAAFATIVAGIVATNGMEGLVLATIMAGVILILMGIFKLGSLIKYIPYTITTGFTAGIAVTILIGQLKDFFGLTYPAGVSPIETVEKVEVFVENFSTVNPWAVAVGVLALAILILWPMLPKVGKIPGSLIAVLVGIGVVKIFDLPVNTIGDLYTVSGSLPSFHMPAISYDLARAVLPDAFTIAVLAAIESLLSCVVADGMTNSKHSSNAELVAQGIGNLGSALFGGIPATGAIARTAANIKNGGRTPIAGMVHAVVLLLILLLLMPYASLIPMPVIAAILFVVAYNMCQWRPFVNLIKTAPRSDIFVLVLTFVLTVVFDLVVAIGVGIVLACVLFMKRMGDETEVRGWQYVEPETDDTADLRPVPLGVRIYEISGPLFFGATDRIGQISVKSFTRCLVLRMRSVPAIDATAMNALISLYERCQKQGITLVFSHVNEQPMAAMEKAGFVDMVGRENFLPHIDEALEYASKIAE